MQERRNTCIMGQYSPLDPTSPPPAMPAGRAGYWRHPGFTLLGTFTQVDWRTGTLSYGDCSAQCDDASGPLSLGCDAFTYTEDDRLCILMVSPLLSPLFSPRRLLPIPHAARATLAASSRHTTQNRMYELSALERLCHCTN